MPRSTGRKTVRTGPGTSFSSQKGGRAFEPFISSTESTGSFRSPPATFSSYVADLPADKRGEDDDPDFDRLSNLVEFALKLDPSTADSLSDGFTLSVLPAASVGLVGEAYHVRLEVNVHPEAEGFFVTPRHYEDLIGSASPVETIEAYGSPTFHLGRQVQFYRAMISIDDLLSAFFRLEVALDE